MKPNINEAGLAIQGYDPVAYFSDTAIAGDAEITSTYDDAIYRFTNAENKAKFDADPNQYAPQYGGFCAVAVSEGKTFPINPETYSVEAGKLYLFYNGSLGNTKEQWVQDVAARKANADQHWQADDIAVVYPTVAY
ncbi:MAG: YHS domain-containing protein [Spirulina sp. SIO3F2]|nr:YHS domain-containing protein [Spirulina sp. SIO3F2]